MNPAEQARAFAAALLGDHGEMLNGFQLTLTHFASDASGPSTRWLPATAGGLASAITDAAGGSTTLGVYVGVGLTRGPRADPAGKRPYRLTKANVDGLAWLWIDIDIAGPAHGYRMPLVPDQATAIALALAPGLAPTVLVNTGHGIQAHWRLREPLIYGCVDSDDDGAPIIDESRIEADRKIGEELAWSWVKSFQLRGKLKGGWHVDPTTDPSRLVRCPGSVNTKIEGDHRPVVMLECDPSRVYDLEDFRAVLMPEKLLAPLRVDYDVLTGDMAGVDLPALWAQAQTFPNHEPPWLTGLFEQDMAPELEALWRGERDGEFAGDDSSIDMALAAALLKWRLSPSDAAQAVMCRRLRIGRKVEKVDPARRVSYLVPTIGKVVARIRTEEAKELARDAEMDAVAATVAPPPELEIVPDPEPDEIGPPEEPEPPTVVGDDEVVSNETPDSVGGEAPAQAEVHEPPAVVHERPSLRAVPAPETDPRDLHPDAVRAPRLGIDDSTPSMFTEQERPFHKALAGQLGLPPEVIVWAVGVRRLSAEDEFRMWLHRSETGAVVGKRWPVNTVRATRWHSKADWDGPRLVSSLLRHDLGLFTAVANRWGHTDNPNGVMLLYKLARPMTEGTPEEVVTLGIVSLIRQTTAGTGLFSTAATTRDPWINEGDEIWVPWGNIRDSIARLGHVAPKAIAFADTLEEMRCKVRSRMEVREGHRTICDTEQWVRIPEELLGSELWAATVARAADRDVADKRNGVRVIGPHEQ